VNLASLLDDSQTCLEGMRMPTSIYKAQCFSKWSNISLNGGQKGSTNSTNQNVRFAVVCFLQDQYILSRVCQHRFGPAGVNVLITIFTIFRRLYQIIVHFNKFLATLYNFWRFYPIFGDFENFSGKSANAAF
jgi:hypothetical protein